MKQFITILLLLFSVLLVYSVEVDAATATLSWTAPTTYTDGSALTIAGFKMYVGTTSGVYSNSVTLGTGTTYLWNNLLDNTTYYFAVSAFDATGNESALSNEVSYINVPVIVNYNITVTSSTGGSVSPSGTIQVVSGSSSTYNFTPSAGFTVSSVLVDGVSVNIASSYTFTNVLANHSLNITFSPVGLVSSNVWQNQSMTAQSGAFIAEYDAIPLSAGSDALTVFSLNSATDPTNGAVTVRFNSNNTIDCINGNSYTANVLVFYTPGITYHFKVVVDMINHVYDIYVTPAGRSAIHLAYKYAFKTGLGTVATLNNFGIFADIGSHQVLNFKVSYPLNIPSNLTVH